MHDNGGINLSWMSRKELSNLLQVAQQCENAGYPLPCLFVAQVIDAHDNLLHSSQQRPVHTSGICRICKAKTSSDVTHTLECGAKVCTKCYNALP